MSRVGSIALLVALAWSAHAALAASTGRVWITTTDTSGAPIPGVELTLAPASGGPARQATTDKKGEYRHNFVPTGRYRVALVDPQRGFHSVRYVLSDRNGVELARDEREVGATQRIDIALGLDERIAMTIVLLDPEQVRRLRERVEVAAFSGDLDEIQRLFAAGEFPAVVTRADAILEKKPDLAVAHYLRGMGLTRLGRDDEAERAFREALDHRPSEPGVAGALGTLLVRRSPSSGGESRMTEALSYLDAELVRSPDDLALLQNRAVALDALGRRDELRLTLDRLRALDPENPQYAAHRVQSLIQEGKLDEARQLLPGIARGYPPAATLAYSIAAEQFNGGRTEEAIATSRLGLEFDEKSAPLHRLLARGLVGLGRDQEALPSLRRVVELEPDDPETEVERKLIESIERAPTRGP